MFPRHHGRGSIKGKDYTKFIKWTPQKVSIAAFLTFCPYAAMVYAIFSATASITAIMPMLIAPVCIGIFAGLMYWQAKKL